MDEELELGLPGRGSPRWEVLVSVPLDPGRDQLDSPRPQLPAGIIGVWSREKFEAGGELVAPDHAEASSLAARAFRAWLLLPGAELTVKPAQARQPIG